MKKLLLLGLLFFNEARALDMTLIIKPSPFGMDWSTPQSLIWSGMKNTLSFQDHHLGHVYVMLNCSLLGRVLSMENTNFNTLEQTLLGGKGLGLLYHSFPGKLEEGTKYEKQVQEHLVNKAATAIKFTLNKGQCERIEKYVEEYVEKNVDRHYGLANRPLYGEGGGSSAFGASFVEVLDFMTDELRAAWTTTVYIPHAYAGLPLVDQQVNGLKVFWKAKTWAQGSEPQTKLTFWDPEKMHQWVLEQQKVNGMKVIEQGVEIDKSYLPVVKAPYWKQEK